jgi:hypothetical protein
VPSQCVRRIGRQDAPLDQGRKLAVEPGHFWTHVDIMEQLAAPVTIPPSRD